MKIRVRLVMACIAIACATHTGVSAAPNLILTSDRVAELKTRMATTHRELWEATLVSADQLAAEPIPTMRDANNRFRRIGDSLPALGLAHLLTGDRRYVDAAVRWLDALLAVPEWKGSQNLGRSAWVVGSALLYDWLRDALPDPTRTRVRERLIAEGEILLTHGSDHRLLSNHCLIETSALGLTGLALRGEHARAAALLQRAQERADAIIEHAPLDGSWGEGVQYWQYGLGYFLRYLEASKTAGDRDYYPRYAWLRQTGYFPIHFSLPGRPDDTVDFGDSGNHDYIGGFLLYLTASVYRNGHYQDYGNRTRSTKPYKLSWMDFVSYDPTVPPVDFTTLPRFQHFADNGFVIARSGWDREATLVAFHCGPSPGHRNQADPRRVELRGFGPGHAHPDINGFSLYARGQWLVLDPGYVHEKWTHDENTVLVNGHGQAGEGSEWLDYMAFQAREPAPKILRAETNDRFDYVIGDAGNVYVEPAALHHFRRHLVFLKPDIVVILDDLGAKRPSRFDWLLQTQREPSRSGGDRFEIEQNGVRLSVHPLQPTRHTARTELRELRAAATSGQIATLKLSVDDVARTTFLVVLAVLPDANARAPEVKFADGRLQIVQPNRTWRVLVSEPKPDDPAAPLLLVQQ